MEEVKLEESVKSEKSEQVPESVSWCSGKKRYCKYSFLRWFLAFIIIVIVFCTGVQVGKFKEEIRGGYGYGHNMIHHSYMMDHGYNNRYDRGGYAPQNMMYYNQNRANTNMMPAQQPGIKVQLLQPQQ